MALPFHDVSVSALIPEIPGVKLLGDRIEQLSVGVGLTQDGVARHGWRAGSGW
jgi:hypothetical protein